MQLVTIDKKLYKKYKNDTQLLHKANRPCVVVLKLKYKGRNHRFAVPIRSNIPAASPKNEYFALPPRPQTRPKHRHGLHYIKMFPILKQYQGIYHTQGNFQSMLMKAYIDKNEKQIIRECQAYLNNYENGTIPRYATDLDYLIEQLYK